METLIKTKNISNFQDMDMKASKFRERKYYFPFSFYQMVLFLFDISLCGISLFLIYTIFLVDISSLSHKDIFSILMFIIPITSFFPMYRLYSYHIIFRKKLHVIRILKAFIWSILSFSVIYFLYEWPFLLSDHKIYYGALILTAAFLIALLGRFFAAYLIQLIMAIGIGFVTVGILGIILGHHYPLFLDNTWVTAQAIAVSMLTVTAGRYFMVHIIFKNWLRRYFRRQMIILGENGIARKITGYVIKHDAPFWISGMVSLDEQKSRTEKKPADTILNKKILGTISELPEIIKENQVDEVIITDRDIEKRKLISLLDLLVSNGIVAWFPPNLLPIIPMKLNIDDFCGLPMIRMGLQRNPGFFKTMKRGMDLVLSFIILIMLAPVLCIIAAAIKLDSSGPVFYRAEAVGEDGRLFKMFKFRSMRADGDKSIHRKFVTKFIKGKIKRGEASVLKITDDPRVTRVGRIIRRLSLDELPQLFNVIRGDMSLVGPRPCLPYEYELYKDWHRKRNSVRPGITGLWQIAGRSEVSFEEMILLDLYYIYNRNILMDLSILFETIIVVLQMEGAY